MLSVLDVLRENEGHLPLPIEEVYRANVATREEIEAEKDEQRIAARIAMGGPSDLERAEAADLAARCAQAGVPEQFRDVALDLRHTEALARGRWLYICGKVGTGKSTMAAGTLRGWMAHNHGTARWTTEADMFSDLRGAISRREPESEALWRYTGPRLLVLDDVGTEPPERAAARLKQVIDARWANGRPTILTAQFGIDVLCRRIAQADPDAARAVGSRLSKCITVALTGPDHRREDWQG